MKIAVLLHLYYIDLWDEFDLYLSNITSDFDLYVNLVYENNNYFELSLLKNKIKDKYINSTILISHNKGVDIGGTLLLLKDIIDNNKQYDLFLKIHSKKSINTRCVTIPNGGKIWRNELLYPLMGNKDITNNIIQLFGTDDNIGLIGAKKWLYSGVINPQITYNNKNRKNIQFFMNKYFKGLFERDITFIGGTMFWCRASIYIDFFKNNLNDIYNLLENGYINDSINGSNTHTMERILGLICIKYNKKIIGL